MQDSKLKNTIQNLNFFNRVYEVVKRIPSGKVTTYGSVADILGTKDARKVGWALHGNQNPKIPCHRVVNKEGKVALNYSMGDWHEQRRKLMVEGVGFIDERTVDLTKYLWKGK